MRTVTRTTVLHLALLSVLATGLATGLGPRAAHAADDTAGTLEVDGRTRTYTLYLPETLAPLPAILVVLHGAGGDVGRIRHLTGSGFDRLADAHGFAVVYPEAWQGSWNDCRDAARHAARVQDVDDVAFVRSVVRDVVATLQRPIAGVAVVGYSNGAHMAWRIAREAPDEIVAWAGWGMSLPAPDNDHCRAGDRALPALLLAGTADPISPFAGGEVVVPGGRTRGAVLAVEESARALTALAGHDAHPVSIRHADVDGDESWIEERRWQAPGLPEVTMVIVERGGHALPHPDAPYPDLVGRVNRDLDGTELVWQFVARQLRR